jgi:hypothetical protein
LNSGPDTDSKKELIPSTDPAAPPAPSPSEWTMRLYSSSEPLNKMPDVSSLTFLGHRTVRSIDFRDVDDFKQVKFCLSGFVFLYGDFSLLSSHLI